MSSLIVRNALHRMKSVVSFRYPTIISLRNASLISLDNLDTSLKKEDTSKAMKSYLERAVAHDAFMRQESVDYKIGKRHLANMMGEDPETFTQEDVDKAIEYLFPSGIYDKYARPVMKPPELIHPSKKAAEFDESGRPHHFLFYTTKSNFFKILYDIASKLKELQNYEDQMIRKNLSPDPNKILVLDTMSSWIDKASLENLIVEVLIEREYVSFIASMDRLLSNPFSYVCKEFIEKFRIKKEAQTKTFDVPQPLVGEDGRKYITVYECLRKNCRGDVTIRSPGTGKLTINGQDITYFQDLQPREQVLFPLIFANMLNAVDIECNVVGGGPSGQSGAIRWGIAWGLRSFVDSEMVEKLRLAGLLTRDFRRVERKKVCQPGARAKRTWRKR